MYIDEIRDVNRGLGLAKTKKLPFNPEHQQKQRAVLSRMSIVSNQYLFFYKVPSILSPFRAASLTHSARG